jgi:hypothetical protein
VGFRFSGFSISIFPDLPSPHPKIQKMFSIGQELPTLLSWAVGHPKTGKRKIKINFFKTPFSTATLPD